MVDFIKGSVIFIEKHFLQIMLTVLLLCLMVIYLTTHNIHIIDRPVHKPSKKVIVENFENPFSENIFFDPNKKSALAFDELCKKDPYKCDSMCNSLNDAETCNTSNSCVWTHTTSGYEKCVAGNHLGATFNPFSYAKTFFQNKQVNI